MKQPKIVTVEEGTAEWERMRQMELDRLIEDLHFTGDVESLRTFILSGGNVHDYDRDLAVTVAGMIGVKPEPNAGGAKDAENIRFYIEVENRRIAPALKSKSNHMSKDAPLADRLAALKKKTSKDDAILAIAEPLGLSFDGGEYRYKQGKKLFEDKFEKGWN
jgi:hypothetical protein